jgi:NADH-quinone oxidoreductase subunit N
LFPISFPCIGNFLAAMLLVILRSTVVKDSRLTPTFPADATDAAPVVAAIRVYTSTATSLTPSATFSSTNVADLLKLFVYMTIIVVLFLLRGFTCSTARQ